MTVNTSLFEKFSAAIRAGAAPEEARLQLGASGPLAVYYAPFEAVNLRAKLVLVGITPGRVQAANALAEARRQLEAGASAEESMRKAKHVGAFSGPMRTNLVEMLDHIGLAWLKIASCVELFGSRADLLQTASVLQFPVFVDGENYSSRPDPIRTPMLRSMVLDHFAQLGKLLPDAVFVPLGPVPTKVMQWLADEGRFTSQQVLAGLPHPSGPNGERIQYFLGSKDASRLSAKTNASLLDAARTALLGKVAQLA
ncbi:MAG: hypothetical protein K0Q43_678 [Ramlibacter sp.]|jgi:hypothetical protein|nr:hypothetical protein [Ramlibacter sp.]MDF2462443.1 hypothetical protein [Ramlibacter sp.]